ncbi:MAG: Ig-like domain-containing protein [Synechococcus sp.]|nr:Ig-like domain-containing protein [Synechococcus sp.]
MTVFIRTMTSIDRLALVLILIFSLIIGIGVGGEQLCGVDCPINTGPRVREFSWQAQRIGGEDTAFILTFDRPMDEAGVAENLVIDPPLPGKISWAGKRLAYTLLNPAPYGQEYQLTLRGVRERFAASGNLGKTMQPFSGIFATRDRALAYVGTDEAMAEKGRLILYNWTKDEKRILTPPNLVVLDFQVYPEGKAILFSAVDRTRPAEGIQDSQLYRVSTGLGEDGSGKDLELILDNRTYQNLRFQLAADGEAIAVQRVKRDDPADFGLWLVTPGKDPQPLGLSGGDFVIAPDGKTIALPQGKGIGIFSLEKIQEEPLNFLPRFGQVVTFSPDGTTAVLVDFNSDNPELRYRRSLYLVNNRNKEEKLLDTDGSVLDCDFNPTETQLYCLLTELVPGEEYQEQPYLVQIDLESKAINRLAQLTEYQDIDLSMAPDGLGLLFSQVVTDITDVEEPFFRTASGEAIAGGQLWLMVPGATPAETQLEVLPFAGVYPHWLP